MRYMCIIKGPENQGRPPQALFEAIDRMGREGAEKGVIVGMGGLGPTAKGARARLKNGKITVTDGPFSEAKEVLGGFGIYEVPALEDAVEWTRRFLQLHVDHWPSFEGEVEIRPLMEAPPGGESLRKAGVGNGL